MEFRGRYGAHSLTSEIQFLRSKAQTELDAANDELQALQAKQEEEATVHQMLSDLPQKIKHPVMVPFGGAAFFPGHLVHTNEVMVDLGSSHIVECSAKHAQGMLSRRMAQLGSEIKGVESRIQSLTLDVQELENQETEGMVDIVEEYDESQHGLFTPGSRFHESKAERKGAPWLPTVPEFSTNDQELCEAGNAKGDDDDKLFAMMDRMAELERKAEAQEAEAASTSAQTKQGDLGGSEKGVKQGGVRSVKRSSGLKKGFLAAPKQRLGTRKDPGGDTPGASPLGFMVQRKTYEGGKVAAEETVQQPVAVPVRGLGEGQVIERNIQSIAEAPASTVSPSKVKVSETPKVKPMSRFKQQMVERRASQR